MVGDSDVFPLLSIYLHGSKMNIIIYYSCNKIPALKRNFFVAFTTITNKKAFIIFLSGKNKSFPLPCYISKPSSAASCSFHSFIIIIVLMLFFPTRPTWRVYFVCLCIFRVNWVPLGPDIYPKRFI